MLLAQQVTPDASTIDVLTVARLCGLVVPLVVAVITKKSASQGLKSVLNVALSAVSGVVALTIAGQGALTISGFFNAIINAFVTSIIAYYGAYKPTGIAGTIAVKTKGFGLRFGSSPELETKDKGAEEAAPKPAKKPSRTRAPRGRRAK